MELVPAKLFCSHEQKYASVAWLIHHCTLQGSPSHSAALWRQVRRAGTGTAESWSSVSRVYVLSDVTGNGQPVLLGLSAKMAACLKNPPNFKEHIARGYEMKLHVCFSLYFTLYS